MTVVFNLTPLANPNLLSSAIAQLKLMPGSGYTVSSSNAANVVIYPTSTANGTGLTGLYYTNSSSTYTNAANFNPTNLVMTRVDPTINFVWGNFTNPIPNAGVYSVRWVGQVEPQYSETYTFDAYTDDGVKLWVNDQLIINNWIAKGASDTLGSITLQAGARYDIRMDYFQGGGGADAQLSWYSPSQSKQIIPANRLFPTNTAPAPTVITSPMSAFAFLGQPLTTPSRRPTRRWDIRPRAFARAYQFDQRHDHWRADGGGQLPNNARREQSVGVGAGALNIQVIDTGSAVSQEIWTNVPGVNVSDIPVS